ncbi:ABC transporter related protein [Methanohalobium evestigatum Z-7303]|uniref:Cobalamin import ATP-binding protein BtuD n=1 Tax=Methanohalobium evestigatum (strain ATCC BAA-1072 / DSM 3721 / NBRC 107634 / OCM 161 / Z-7303) TaxID=644295 RepID=D7E9Q1_METEZ|nr:ABC transporter ATP-binding protein [Methanohalobium evestigatum]ADI74323.1 ABC transporter related protein [Methanohalobium evestigatum Z-7303]
MMDVDNLEFNYKSGNVLKDIGFELYHGEILAILGPNGVGKTTLLRCINNILPPKKGIIKVEDEEILSMKNDEIARRLGYVPQRSEVGRLTAFDAILLGRKPHMGFHVKDKDIKIVNFVINKLELEELSLRNINELSGGELQKVMFARALVQEPKVLLLDEPTSSLDLKNQLGILKTVRQTVDENQISAVFTMHDLNLALRFADRYVLVKNGRVFKHGGSDIITPENIEQVYEVKVDVEYINGYHIVIPSD